MNADAERLTEDGPLAWNIVKWSSGADDLNVTQSSYVPAYGDGLVLNVSYKPCVISFAYLLQPKAREVGLVLMM